MIHFGYWLLGSLIIAATIFGLWLLVFGSKKSDAATKELRDWWDDI